MNNQNKKTTFISVRSLKDLKIIQRKIEMQRAKESSQKLARQVNAPNPNGSQKSPSLYQTSCQSKQATRQLFELSVGKVYQIKNSNKILLSNSQIKVSTQVYPKFKNSYKSMSYKNKPIKNTLKIMKNSIFLVFL